MSEITTLPSAFPVTLQAPGAVSTRVALAGCGVVGGALAELVARRAGGVTLTRVLIRDPARPRPECVAQDALTTDPARLVGDDVDTVVEAMVGIRPALGIARAALRRGIHFVTANKALVARHGPELEALAAASGARFRFEAAVGGGVPVIRAVRDGFRHTGIRAIRGVLNGTCNHVLTRMEAGLTFADAVRDAQDLGYAEADPRRDLDGRDTAAKLRILAWQAWGLPPSSLPVRRRGLLPDPTPLVREARAQGRVVRLVAECRRVRTGARTAAPAAGTMSGPATRLIARVGPRSLDPGSELARATGAGNRIVIDTDDGHTYGLSGPGAGGAATAAALLSDLMDVQCHTPDT